MRREEPVFPVDDLVLIIKRTLSSTEKNFFSKLAKKFYAPFRLTKQLSTVVYEVSNLDEKSVSKVYLKDFKKYQV